MLSALGAREAQTRRRRAGLVVSRRRGWAALVAPVGTPDAIVKKVSDALRQAVGDIDVQKKLAATGSYVRPMSPAEVMAFIRADQQMWKPILEQIAANP